MREQVGAEHYTTAIYTANRAAMLVALGQDEEAARLFAEALDIDPTAVEGRGPQGAERRSLYGVLLTRQGRHTEAESHLQAAVQAFTDRLGPDEPRTLRARHRLADLYDAWGRPEQAANLRRDGRSSGPVPR